MDLTIFTPVMERLIIINGPNLDKLGEREPAIYGTRSLDDIIGGLRMDHPGIRFEDVRTNDEGRIVSAIHEAGDALGIVLNAGGYSHTSVAIRDAIAMARVPVVEVHLSNLLAREPFRHVSLIGGVCAGCIMGFGPQGYSLAVQALLALRARRPDGRDR